eukprot:jgi/Tetstr1/423886/TSEL_014509.t1
MEAAESSYRMNGAALGALLHTVKTAGRQVDGFLFGCRTVQQVKRTSDQESDATAEEELVMVTATHCNTTSCSFYDQAGDLLPTALDTITALEAAYARPVVGWFSARRGPMVQPSVRDAAVCSQFPSRAAGRPILCVIGCSQHAGGAIDTYHHCFYRGGRSGAQMRLVPIDMQITNAGASQQHASLPASLRSSMVGASALGPAGSGKPRSDALQQATRAQTASIEAMFEHMVGQLDVAAKEVALGMQQAEEQQARNRALRDAVHAARAGARPRLTVSGVLQEVAEIRLNR